MSETIALTKKQIEIYLNMREPFIFVDHVDTVPGKSAVGYRDFFRDEWFFDCHFVDNPVVPGIFQLELLMQTAVMAIHTLEKDSVGIIYGKKFVNVDFTNTVLPGERLFSDTEITSYRRGCIVAVGQAYVLRGDKKNITCKAELQMVCPDVFKKLLPVRKDK